ncbi:glutamate carboxypeptidase II [Emydomyces testavorans]|uniref:Glutamate carboxypeptidase II n=1 Tax=Emydomyces testavorans TaxID=2070801 RepID=A0AAF0DBP0_9EURO|nr:glutamate carboxypeptidase II [Emydomyces testavorans]
MSEQKPVYDSLPIPTYEEATSSRPTSSRSCLGPEEVSADAERQQLLGHASEPRDSRYPRGYQPPTVESARSSVDFLASSNEGSVRDSIDSLRRELEHMDVEDPQDCHRSARSAFSKRLIHFKRTLSSIHLPIRKYFPTFSFRLSFLRSSGQDAQKCMILLRLFAVLIVASIIYFLVVSDIFSFGGGLDFGRAYDPESVRNFVQGKVNETNIAENLEFLTQFPHIAGTEGNYALAEYMQRKFRAAGLESVDMERFDVYLNYPRKDGRRVAIVEPAEKRWEAKIDEEKAYTRLPREQTLVFHGHSKSGNVTGPLVYANFGSREDFKALVDMGVKVKDSIVLVKYYGSQGDRALKVKAAELAGAAGCIIYSDPAEDGFGKGPAWPKGRYMPSDGVQRGGVSMMSWVVGDVLSPGFPSNPEEEKRLPVGETPGLPKIPSLPIAWRDAQHLLQAIQGHGKQVPKEWVGGVPDVKEWWTGDHASPKVNLMNLQDEVERQPIYNVLGKITGVEQPEKKIVVGSHRDAWCFGAADPGSGSAVLLEMVRIFGELRALGWRPLRTIEFASWDGEEYNLIGSTEYVEKRVEDLRSDGFAYLNVDVAVSGEKFWASASPVFERSLQRVLKRVPDPKTGETLRNIWDKNGSKLQGLGAGSDYVAFQDIAGTSSIDFGFEGDRYPYHSCYDNFDWMSTVGDPGFRYHRALGQIWGLLLLEMSDRPILPFNLSAYAASVTQYVSDLLDYAKEKSVPLKPISEHARKDDSDTLITFQPLYDAAKVFRENSHIFHEWANAWNNTLYENNGFESKIFAIRRLSHNSHMAYFETDLLDLEDGGGVPNRTQFKHIIFGPQKWSGYDEAFFPAIRDAIDSGNWTETQHWIDKVSKLLTRASIKLNH